MQHNSKNIKRHYIIKIINFKFTIKKVNQPYLWQTFKWSGWPNVKYENIEQKTSCGYLNATLKNSLPTMLHKVQTASMYCGSMLMIYQITSDRVYKFWHSTIRISRIGWIINQNKNNNSFLLIHLSLRTIVRVCFCAVGKMHQEVIQNDPIRA